MENATPVYKVNKMSDAYTNKEAFLKLKQIDPDEYEVILQAIIENHFGEIEGWPERKMYRYEYWLRVDKVTRVLPPNGKWTFDIETDALGWANVIMYSKAYEVDRIDENGSVETIFVSDKAQDILNGLQLSLF